MEHILFLKIEWGQRSRDSARLHGIERRKGRENG